MARPYKIERGDHSKRIGVVASTLVELVAKAKTKFGVSSEERVHVVLEEDGTEVDEDEYFQTLPPQTLFIILEDGEEWHGYVSNLQQTTERILQSVMRNEIHDQIMRSIELPEWEKMYKVLSAYICMLSSNEEANHREDDPDWFDGIHEKYVTKEDFMKTSAQARIRNFLAKTKEALNMDDKKSQAILQKFKTELKKQRYFEEYFARSGKSKIKYCSDQGWIACEGPFNKNSCSKVHKINPYSNKESRVVFSTWNLDHRIEKSREVLPVLVKALEECQKGYEVNWKYFFELLFTRKNLKLVHIVCHDKSSHTGYKCNNRKIYIKAHAR